MDETAIRHEARARGITRLCHFTPSRNLAHILASGRIQPRAQVPLDVLNPTDEWRLDGRLDYVSCSLEFPNAWFFRIAREREETFRDWVILLVRPDSLWAPGTLFCPRNAAAGGALPGADAFIALFDSVVRGAYGKPFCRAPRHLEAAPTDDQAEVLVPGSIPTSHVLSVAVGSLEQAALEIGRLQDAGVWEPGLRFAVSPGLFDARGLSAAIRQGRRPPESVFRSGSLEDAEE